MTKATCVLCVCRTLLYNRSLNEGAFVSLGLSVCFFFFSCFLPSLFCSFPQIKTRHDIHLWEQEDEAKEVPLMLFLWIVSSMLSSYSTGIGRSMQTVSVGRLVHRKASPGFPGSHLTGHINMLQIKTSCSQHRKAQCVTEVPVRRRSL